jgi:hypothetical protein
LIKYLNLIIIKDQDDNGLQPEVTADQYSFSANQITSAANNGSDSMPKFSF